MTEVSTKKLKHVDEKTKYTVYGYVREIQKLFPKQNSYYNIPIGVIHFILLYYYKQLQLNKKYIGKDLKLIDHKTIEKIDDSFSFSTFIFGDEINKNICNEFDIYCKITNCATYYSI